MAKNRAQRRADRKAQKKDEREVSQSATSQWMYDQKAANIENGQPGQWRPGKIESRDIVTSTVALDAKLAHAHSAWGYGKAVAWTLIVLSAIAFLVVMWIPQLPTWAIITVSAVFIAGVLSLFIIQSPRDVNPNVDENGTAV